MTPPFSIGIDVGKAYLDVGTSSRYLGKFENTQSGHKKIVKKLQSLGAISGVYMESTGVYSRGILEFLYAAGLTVFLVQPSRIRHFAESIGQRAKTDKIDSMLIALFGERNAPRAYAPPSASTNALRALVARRDQIIDDRTRESNRLEACALSSMRIRIKRSIVRLEKEEALLSKEIDTAISGDPVIQEKRILLEKTKGVGAVTVSVLLAYLPELGTMGRQHMCALSGLAPYDNSSGKHTGKKSATGGRVRIRRALYMAALSGMRWNKELKIMYTRLVGRGKRSKVALVACARKLLIYLNSLCAQLLATKNIDQHSIETA